MYTAEENGQCDNRGPKASTEENKVVPTTCHLRIRLRGRIYGAPFGSVSGCFNDTAEAIAVPHLCIINLVPAASVDSKSRGLFTEVKVEERGVLSGLCVVTLLKLQLTLAKLLGQLSC
jgi:hypothetical protein